MQPGIARFAAFSAAGRRQRRRVLLTAMPIAIALGAGLVSYRALNRTALQLAQRTLLASDAGNLAAAGRQEALDYFHRMNGGVAAATACTGWTLSGTTATRTLPPVNRDQNAIGKGKVFVSGSGSRSAAPVVIPQATFTPCDGGPAVVRLLRIGLALRGTFINGVVGLAGLSLKGQPQTDSFNSNPTNSPTGPGRKYSAAISAGHALVVTLAGARFGQRSRQRQREPRRQSPPPRATRDRFLKQPGARATLLVNHLGRWVAQESGMKPPKPSDPALENETTESGATATVRVATVAEREWFDTHLSERPYLGAGRSVGDYLRQIVTVRGQVAALLVWGPACYALKDRDRWIGWSANQRVERLKLMVQNRRFLVLGEKGRLHSHPAACLRLLRKK